METVNRRVTYRLYPTPAQADALQAQHDAHRCLYNAALEQRRAAWQRQHITLSLDWGVARFLSVFLAWLWLYNNRSQELAAYRGVQNLLLEPQV